MVRTIFLPDGAALDLDVAASFPAAQVPVPAPVALRLGCVAKWRTGVQKDAYGAITSKVEMGLSTPDMREFFLTKGDATGVLIVRRKEDGTWHASMAKTLLPTVLGKEALASGWMPPPGMSGLPASLEAVVPAQFQYWKSTDPTVADATRKSLVESGFFGEDLIKVVDGDLRLCVQEYFLYEPEPAAPPLMKRAPNSAVLDALEPLLDSHVLEQPHTVEKDFAAELRRVLKKSNTLVFCSSPGDSASSIVDAVLEKTDAQFLIEGDANADTIAQFAKIGIPFRIEDVEERVFVASYDIASAVYLTEKGEERDPVQKPFAGFTDFDACVVSQKKDGYSDEAAHRICGKLQADTEKSATEIVKRVTALKIRLRKGAAVAPPVPAEEHYVLGEVLVPEDIDAQNDIYSNDEVKQTAHKFLEQFRNVGLMHKNIINDKVKILESYLMPCDWQVAEGTVIKKGTWMMGVKVLDPALWEAIKGGELTGFSIGGSAIRAPDPNGGVPQNPPATPAG
jgi:hypothetical protein